MVIDNNDSGTFRPVAIMIVGKAEIKEAFYLRKFELKVFVIAALK